MYGQGMNFSNWSCGFGSFMPGPIGMVLTILFWFLLISLAVQLVRSLFSSKTKEETTTTSNRAEETLKERYAAGEISKTEFYEMKKEIA